MNNVKTEKNWIAYFGSTFLLLGAMAVFAIIMASVGVTAYDRIAETGENNYSLRTSLNYCIRKLDSYDVTGSIEIADDGKVLKMYETYGEEVYVTRIYCYDGFLCESFASDQVEFFEDEGEQIVKLSGFFVNEVADGLFKITVTDRTGDSESSYVCLRSEGGGI